jgi:hypothetical protein
VANVDSQRLSICHATYPEGPARLAAVFYEWEKIIRKTDQTTNLQRVTPSFEGQEGADREQGGRH